MTSTVDPLDVEAVKEFVLSELDRLEVAAEWRDAVVATALGLCLLDADLLPDVVLAVERSRSLPRRNRRELQRKYKCRFPRRDAA
jgi:hypothetical protein